MVALAHDTGQQNAKRKTNVNFWVPWIFPQNNLEGRWLSLFEFISSLYFSDRTIMWYYLIYFHSLPKLIFWRILGSFICTHIFGGVIHYQSLVFVKECLFSCQRKWVQEWIEDETIFVRFIIYFNFSACLCKLYAFRYLGNWPFWSLSWTS